MKVSEVGTLIDLSILLEDKENNTKKCRCWDKFKSLFKWNLNPK